MKVTPNDLREFQKSEEFKKYNEKQQRHFNLWNKIYARRKDLWLTQWELWKLSWIPQNKISDLEHWVYWSAWIDLLERLSESLNIALEYLSSDNITRKTFELYNIILSNLKKPADIMQFMKIPYFIDLEAKKTNWIQISNYNYIRWGYWPFDKKVYEYQYLFSVENEKGIDGLKYIHLSEDEIKIIDDVLKQIPKENWKKLRDLSYETKPMKKLWVCLGDDKCMGEELELV